MHMFLSLSDFPATFNYRSGQGVQNLCFHVFFYHCFSMEKLYIDAKWKVQIEKMMEEMPLMIQIIQNSRKFIEKTEWSP